MKPEYETIIVEEKGPLGIVTLNRPRTHNALNPKLIDEMLEVLAEWDNDPKIRVVIVRNNGPNFCSGHDFHSIVEADVLGLRRMFRSSLHLMDTIESLRKPVIAAVRGYAIAMGCAVAAGCDLVVAADSAKFQLPGTRWGAACLSPVAVVCRSVGLKKSLEMVVTGRPISADEEERIGLVNKVVPLEELDKAAEEMAAMIVANAPLGVEFAKEAVYAMVDMERRQAYRYGAELMSIIFNTEDGREGADSFLEKRKHLPWKGR